MSSYSTYQLPDAVGWSSLAAHLSSDYVIGESVTQRQDIVLYDTFDWRLFNEGLTLYDADGVWCLRPLGEQEVVVQEKLSARPTFLWDLPDGALKTYLDPIIEMRALLRLGAANVAKMTFHVNRKKQPVAKLVVQEVRAVETADELPMVTYLSVKPLKKANKRFRAFIAQLTELGASATKSDIYVPILTLAEREPGDYSAKLKFRLKPNMRSDEATKIILRFLLGVVRRNEDYLPQDIDTEFLHDFRVAIRRTRSALSQVKAVFPAETTERFKQDWATVGRMTNDLRDLDVYLLEEESYRNMLPATLQPHIVPLFELLHTKRAEALQQVTQDLDGYFYQFVTGDWAAFLDEPPTNDPTASNAARPIIELAKERIYRKYRRVVKDGKRILENMEDELLHDLRIECKKLRYLLEFFTSLFPAGEMKYLIKQLKSLQRNLGDFNDFYVQQEYLLAIADELSLEDDSTRQTLLAIGALIGTLDRKQQAAKASFEDVFTQFTSRENRNAFKALFKS